MRVKGSQPSSSLSSSSRRRRKARAVGAGTLGIGMPEPVGLRRMGVRVRAPELGVKVWDGSATLEVARDERATEEP
jgi:hypothetical protein